MLIFGFKCETETDLIQLQFPTKHMARHSNQVAKTFNYVEIVTLMLLEFENLGKECYFSFRLWFDESSVFSQFFNSGDYCEGYQNRGLW
jgi:hypothetical protein